MVVQRSKEFTLVPWWHYMEQFQKNGKADGQKINLDRNVRCNRGLFQNDGVLSWTLQFAPAIPGWFGLFNSKF
jgi:hypothetical protein